MAQRPGSGVISKNKKKEQPKHPDIKGELTTPDGTEYWISGWQKDGKEGPFYSLALTAKEDKPAQKASSSGGGGQDRYQRKPVDDDAIPF